MHLALDSIAATRRPYESAPKQTVILNSVVKKDFKWPKKNVKALGVWLSTDPDLTIFQNYKDKLEKIKATLGCWKFGRLSPLEKVVILKSLITSQTSVRSIPYTIKPRSNQRNEYNFLQILMEQQRRQNTKKCNDKKKLDAYGSKDPKMYF